MSKEVQMTFRVEPELRAAFSDAALLEDRPAAQVLREFMRAYVNLEDAGQVRGARGRHSVGDEPCSEPFERRGDGRFQPWPRAGKAGAPDLAAATLNRAGA